jgi:hypothetical protein
MQYPRAKVATQKNVQQKRVEAKFFKMRGSKT